MDTVETDRKPTGYIEIPEAWMENEETCKKLIDILSTCVATGLPFVEFQKAYQAINPDGFDISSIVYHALPDSEPQKHDGTLEGQTPYTVTYSHARMTNRDYVRIDSERSEQKNEFHFEVCMTPRQFLSLLAWGEQEKPTLIKLVEEQGL